MAHMDVGMKRTLKLYCTFLGLGLGYQSVYSSCCEGQ